VPEAGVGAARSRRAGQECETVLLVEDEEMVRQLAVRILEQEGYNILEANDAMQAMDLHGKHQGPIQLMITDIVMPRSNGYELAEKISKERPETKILFISGYVNEAIAKAGFPQSRVSFLKKPFTPDELSHMVRTLLN